MICQCRKTHTDNRIHPTNERNEETLNDTSEYLIRFERTCATNFYITKFKKSVDEEKKKSKTIETL